MAIAIFGAGRAFGQASDPDLRPTRGPFITGGMRAGTGDATDTELNPAALALMPAGDAEIVGAAAGQGGTIPRRGAGLYLAAPFWSSALGFGLTRVSGTGDAPIDSHTTLRLAYALRLGRHAAIGAAWAHIWDGTFASTDTFDLGLSLLAGRHLALAFTVEDVGQPHPSARITELPRLWTGELAFRPLGTRRLEIALGAAHADSDRWAAVVPWLRVLVQVTNGFGLYAQAERVPAYGQGPFGGHAYTNAGIGLTVDLEHLGLMAATHGYFEGSNANAPAAPAAVPVAPAHTVGFAGRLRVNGARQPAVLNPPYVARVSLEGIHDDRAFFHFVRRLRALAADPGTVAVLFKLEGLDLGYGRIEEVRDLIAALRARGKRTFAYVTFPSTREYYLAAACDTIVIHPAGTLGVTGVAQNVTFYKGAMDRLGVHLELVRAGAYKGAMEPFVMTEQSAPVRANKNQLLDDVYGRVTATIAADRTRAGHPMDAAMVRSLVDRGVFVPGDAVLAGLVDAQIAEGDLEAALGRTLGRPHIAVRDPDGSPEAPVSWPGRRVAVLFVDGTIVDGPSAELPFGMGGFAGADTLVAALERCRREPSIGAVVLRVNSPGGSAFASDVIAREIQHVRAAGKPIVVSMGDLAASGGYYIAAPADVVYADPSTLTGSIGVFGYKVDGQKLLDSVGVNVETFRRGAHADILSAYRPWTEAERAIVENEIHHLYSLFLQTVADGRKRQGLTVARVDAIGEGHVWTGALAGPIGLVDRMGGISAAIDEAARLGAVPLGNDQLPELVLLPAENKGLLHKVASAASALTESDGEAAAAQPARLLTGDVRAALRLLAPYLLHAGNTGIEARLPYELELR
ncbi:MAG: signal peptide peptidase SppA [Polyangia bacterium]